MLPPIPYACDRDHYHTHIVQDVDICGSISCKFGRVDTLNHKAFCDTLHWKSFYLLFRSELFKHVHQDSNCSKLIIPPPPRNFFGYLHTRAPPKVSISGQSRLLGPLHKKRHTRPTFFHMCTHPCCSPTRLITFYSRPTDFNVM